jgi:ubiquinone/menaquinone biosynthesis C-methylase UbiE
MRIPRELLGLLRDPAGLEPLELEHDQLVNKVNRRAYPIIDSIPVLLDKAELGPQNRKIQGMYQWMSHGFDLADRVGNLFSRGANIEVRRRLAQKLALKPGDRCLYTSIGTGLNLPYLEEQVPLTKIDLIGLDLSIEMLRRCQQRIRGHEQSVMLVQANAEDLPFPDGVFDVVFHVGGINLFDRPGRAVQEMARVAKPGALVLFTDESRKVVKEFYQKWNPFTRAATRGAATDFDPRAWVPAGTGDFAYEEVWNGMGYILTFRAAGLMAACERESK